MTAFPLALGYLVFEASRVPAWRRFCGDVLGLPAPIENADGSLGWQIDDASQRLIVQPGPADDLAAMGFECSDDAALDAVLAHLQRAGSPAAPADAALRQARRVRRLYALRDPEGNAVELFTGLAPAERPFASQAFPQGFRTGQGLGLGHVVLVGRDLARLEAFYAALPGFGVTERLATRVGPIEVRGTFLHCNRRHHSLALFDLPLPKRLHHFMLQAPNLHDTGIAYERARGHKVPISLGLGQHPAPDGTFSFYGATPSGFDFEIGAGARQIEPDGWTVRHATRTSAWGHRPALRLRLKMVGGLLRSRLGRRRAAAAGAAR